MAFWLFKSEPITFSFQHLNSCTDKTTGWDGVRNYQARNRLRDDIKVGDKVLFYHSNTDLPGIAGIAEVVEDGGPDPTAFDRDSQYYDPKSQIDAPTWYQVKIRALRAIEPILPLSKLRESPALRDMELCQRGSRLSVQTVSTDHWKTIMELAGIQSNTKG